jgi:hypothetical protein
MAGHAFSVKESRGLRVRTVIGPRTLALDIYFKVLPLEEKLGSNVRFAESSSTTFHVSLCKDMESM